MIRTTTNYCHDIPPPILVRPARWKRVAAVLCLLAAVLISLGAFGWYALMGAW